jgi:WD40 repeat protein
MTNTLQLVKERSRAVAACLILSSLAFFALASDEPNPLAEGRANDRWQQVFSSVVSSDGRRLFISHHPTPGVKTPGGRLLDLTTGRELAQIEPYLARAAFSRDGKQLVAVGAEAGATAGKTRLLDADSGKELRATEGPSRPWAILTFSPDLRLTLVRSLHPRAGAEGAATVRETFGGKVRAILPYNKPFTAADFSPDGQRVVTMAEDRTGRVWDTNDGRELYELQVGERVRAVQFIASGNYLLVIAGRREDRGRVLEAASGRHLLTLATPPYRNLPLSLMRVYFHIAVVSPDGRRVLTQTLNDDLALWDLTRGGEPLALLQGHVGEVFSGCFSPDGKLVLTTSKDRTARLWEATTGKTLAVLRGHEGAVTCGAFAPSGMLMVTGSEDRTARLWTVRTGRELATLRGLEAPVEEVAIGAKDQYVFARGEQRARLWPVGPPAARF